MLAALLACAALSLGVVEFFDLTSNLAYAILAMMTLVVAGYVVPNVAALWLGRPLADIMTDDKRAEPSRAQR